uniref:Glycosyltransferase n=1 Tax=Dictyoglomus turgidum TaxID=513050 RepID=A0A7C3SRG9_9BACT
MAEFSVVLVTFNRLDFTKQTIDSFIKTSPPDFEMIIVDNASTESGFQEYLTELEKDKRIKVIRNKTNLGWGAAVNIGLKYCHTEWILLSNNDVIYKEGWFEKCIQAYQDFSEIGVLGLWKHPFAHTTLFEKERGRTKLVVRDLMPAVAWFMKKEVIKKVGKFFEAGPCVNPDGTPRRGGCGEDTDYNLRVSQIGLWNCGLKEDVAVHITRT